MNIEPKIIEANDEHFIIHFNNDGTPDYNMRWSGSATQIQMFNDGNWKYQSNKSSGFVKQLKEARIWFEWSFCWRGVWEGRVYFKDDEYWSEEMETIPAIWRQIEAIVKDKIKSDNLDYQYFDE